jgi:hypothetical protein
MLLKIGALIRTSEDADASSELVWRVPRVFKRVPGNFEKQAVGRIENRRFEWRQSEKLGVEAAQLG